MRERENEREIEIEREREPVWEMDSVRKRLKTK